MYNPTCLISSSPDPVFDHHQEVAIVSFNILLEKRMLTVMPRGICIPSVIVFHLHEDARMVSEVHLQIDDTWTASSEHNKNRTIRLRAGEDVNEKLVVAGEDCCIQH